MHARRSSFTAFLLLVACGPSGPASTDAVSTSTGGESSDAERSLVQRLNDEARQGAVTDTLHGVSVADPYRLLEEDSELTQRWIQAQTDRTEAALAQWTAPQAAQRLDALLSIGSLGGPHLAGDRLFYTKREGDREQPALYVREGHRLREQPLVDPLTYGERAALDWYYPSPRGRYVAFGISSAGDERSTLRIVEVSTGRILDDVIERAKWSAVSWLHAEDGFYYRRYPRPGEPDYDTERPETYHIRLFFHPLGADPAHDPLVYAPPDGTDFPAASVSEDDRWVVISNFRGWSQSDLFLFDRGADARARVDVPTDERPLREVVRGQDHLYSGTVHRGRLYITTNDGAPRYRVVTVSPDEAADRARWQVVVPEGEGTIENLELLRDHLVVHSLENIASRVRVYRLDGQPDGEIALPGRGELFGFHGDADTGRVALGFSSFVHPPALYGWSVDERQLIELDRVQTDFDFAAVELDQVQVPSADGTPVNVYYAHRRGMRLDGSNRVLLTAYGGFNVSLLPGFQRNALYWIERGGVYAVANLRGGGEYGEDWHRAGNLANKPRVFEDFEAVIRWFGGASNISRPERIAITGGSNGGLLMGALITRAPDAFAASVANVGLYDMVRYHRFPPAELWITEYGSAEDPEQLGWLLGYSPYHRVRDGARYPAVLVTTADHDTRVHWAHSTKFAARLQEATGLAEPPIYFHLVRDQGHGAGTRRSDTVDRYVRMFSFIEQHLARP